MILTKILPGLLGVLACASISMASGHAAYSSVTLSRANELAVQRYAKQYISNREGKHILKGILWVESKYGKYKKGNGSYGIAQIEIPTARYVARKFGFKIPKSDRGVKDMLMRDDRMSIKLAAAYLGMLEKRFGSLDHVIVAYNLGPTKLSGIAVGGRRVTTDYLTKVMEITRQNKRALRAAASLVRLAKKERKAKKPVPVFNTAKTLVASGVYETALSKEQLYGPGNCEDSPWSGFTREGGYGYEMSTRDSLPRPEVCKLESSRACSARGVWAGG